VKVRADQLLVDRGLAESREKAKALLLAGSVTLHGQKLTKAGTMVAADAALELAERMPYVSRGGFKLAGALDHWRIPLAGRVCLDCGSSTGGFTDCMLQRGAARVHCVDVGAGQLHWNLRNDLRVVLHEGVNARYLEPALIGEPVAFASCDLSFISVTLILPALVPLVRPPRELVVLVKPQFEVGRDQVGKGGIVRDPALHDAACRRVREAAEALGLVCDLIESPIQGMEGNKEFLLYARDPECRHHLEA
jgi:23S rRNA (cytidine1920-2'-O)/16S rRNA (cytidine1409-2'-O)-methyltransferase